MRTKHIRYLLILACIVTVTLPSLFCTSPKSVDDTSDTEHPSSPWRNVYDTSAHYVGMETCRGCHAEVYNTFIKTGMGQSFDVASKSKSAADFSAAHALVYDTANDFYYKPFWKGDDLYIKEFRLSGKDTVHKREQKIDYIVGSGQHTNSHIFNINGYLYQAPITFYTQKHQWDLAPGFEKGANSRFNRMIQLECMSCHNGYPEFDANSENKYTRVAHGIDCERCHGPGSLHVNEKMAGKIIDTSKEPDYSIVNPRRLSTELQNNVCQRCHLQGIAVLNDGKSFYDFHPGMKLSEVMNVFMPQYDGAQDKMIMASHVERMKKSDCFVQSGKMSCITCHNPHVSVKFTPKEQYITACNNCHGQKNQQKCSASENVRLAKNNDCITCHMPHNGSIDIPHVAVTDHYIRKNPANKEEVKKITAFLGMKSYNNDNPDAITYARSFMEFYERYTPSDALLDSAIFHLNKDSKRQQEEKQNKDFIRAYFLKKDYPKVIGYASQLDPSKMKDAWACYRVGESYVEQNMPEKALPWYEKCVSILPNALDFENKYGICLLMLGQEQKAFQVFQKIIQENPNHISANTNLGYLYMQQGNATMAYDRLLYAQMLDPDYEQNLINLAVWYHNSNRNNDAAKCLEHLLKKHPKNEQAKMMLADLAKGS